MKSEKRDFEYFKSTFTVLIVILTLFFMLFAIIVKGAESISGKSEIYNQPFSSELLSKK